MVRMSSDAWSVSHYIFGYQLFWLQMSGLTGRCGRHA